MTTGILLKLSEPWVEGTLIQLPMVSFSTGLLSSLNRCQPSLQFTLQICFVTARVPGVLKWGPLVFPVLGQKMLAMEGSSFLGAAPGGRLGDWPAPGFLPSVAQTLGLQMFIGFLDF